MKKFGAIMLSLAMAATFAACSSSETNSTVTTTTEEGLWADAIYVEDAVIGEGSKEIELTVSAEEKSVVLTIYTDADTLGDALLENEVADGSVSEWGLYVEEVNGMLADYDANGAYWAFYIDGEYAPVGVDGAELVEGEVNAFELAYEVYVYEE